MRLNINRYYLISVIFSTFETVSLVLLNEIMGGDDYSPGVLMMLCMPPRYSSDRVRISVRPSRPTWSVFATILWSKHTPTDIMVPFCAVIFLVLNVGSDVAGRVVTCLTVRV